MKWEPGQKRHEARDTIKFLNFMDYNGYMFPMGDFDTLSEAQEAGRKTLLKERVGARLTVRTFKQVWRGRHKKTVPESVEIRGRGKLRT